MAPVSLRFKRKDTTIFLFCEATDTFGSIKQRVRRGVRPVGERHPCASCSQPPFPLCPTSQLSEHVGKDAREIRLMSSDKLTEFADMAVTSDFPLVDDSFIYVLLGPSETPFE